MRAIFIKELRENGKWAALMFAAAAIALGAALSSANAHYHSTIGNYAFPLMTSLGFPAIGFAIGLLQVLQDSNPGRWGFLTHRPISRSQILWGKILAGVCLYFLATLVPLGVAEYWISLPGLASAPYVWQMELPRLADAVGGLMWYAAGLLVGARQARWIGSRLMPIGMALAGSFAAFMFPLNMGHALLIIAGGLLIILPAAWGAFTSGDNPQRQPIIAKLAAGLCVTIGIGCALAALAGFATSMIRPHVGSPVAFDYKVYQIATDGRVVILHITRNGVESKTDLQGNLVIDKPTPGNSSRVNVSLQNNEPPYMSVGFQREAKYLHDLGYFETEHWFYVVPRKTIEGFNTNTNEFVGSLGPGGFVPPNQEPQPFPEPLQVNFYSGTGSTVVASAGTAYQIDPVHRTIAQIFVADAGDEILAANGNQRGQEDDAIYPVALIVTRKAAYYFESGKERFHTPLKHPFSEINLLQFCPMPDGNYELVYWNSNSEKDPWAWVDEVDGQGRLVQETAPPQLRMPNFSSGSSMADLPLIAVVPPGLDLSAHLWARAKSIPDPFGLADLIAIVVVALGALCATAFLAGGMGFSRRAQFAWSLLNVLLGCTGVLLLLSLFTRIAKVPCPSCKKPRLVTRERCEHCNAPFSAPAVEGIEVFENA